LAKPVLRVYSYRAPRRLPENRFPMTRQFRHKHTAAQAVCVLAKHILAFLEA
jgi:hypothetical protein